MISHSPGATRMQETPSRRQLQAGGYTIRFEVGQAVVGEGVQTVEPGERRSRRGAGEGRIQKHDVEPFAGRRRPAERVRAQDLDVVRAKCAGCTLERRGGGPVVLDHHHRPRPARCRLESERPGPGEEVETAHAFDPGAQPVEESLAHSIRCGANPSGGLDTDQPAAPSAGDDAHGASRCRTFHAGGGRTRTRPVRPRCHRARATIAGPPLEPSFNESTATGIPDSGSLFGMAGEFVLAGGCAEDV